MESPDSTNQASLAPSEQARIRRERRKAKVTQGADRLKKITSTQKGDTSYKDDEVAAADQPRMTDSAQANETHDDPPVADIAEHDWEPKVTPRQPQQQQQPQQPQQNAFGAPDDPLGQLMAGNPFFQQQGGAGGPAGGIGGMGATGMEEDPMFKLMQRLMGDAGGAPGASGMPQMGSDGFPPGLASAFAGMQNGNGQQTSDIDPYTKWWTVLHSICAILLGLYAAWTTGFNFAGTKEERLAGMFEDIPVFWYFATMELVLQSTRYIMEKGRPPPGSILSKIGSILPSPFGPFLITLARYSVIWSTIVNDGALLLFVLGGLSWWNSRNIQL